MEQSEYIEIVYGNDDVVVTEFDFYDKKEENFVKNNNGNAPLSGTGFPEEWREWVDYKKSYGFIKDGKLYVRVYGIPDWMNPQSVKDYFVKTLNSYLDRQHGEFFETLPGHPLCFKLNHKGEERVI